MKKDVFIDRHKLSDIVEDYKTFLNKIKECKPYLVEFNKNDTIKNKIYLLDCPIRGKNCQLITIIIHDKCIFLVNDNIYKTWTKVGNTFLHLKGQR